MKKKELKDALRAAELRIARLETELAIARSQRQPTVWPSGPIWIDPRYYHGPGWRITTTTGTNTSSVTGVKVPDPKLLRDLAWAAARS